MSQSMFAKGQRRVPICYSGRRSSVQFYHKIDFSFPATGAAAGNFALISGITSLVSLRKLVIAKLCAGFLANANAPEKCMQMMLRSGLWHLETFQVSNLKDYRVFFLPSAVREHGVIDRM